MLWCPSFSIDAVVDFYGDMTAHHLSELTHREEPWLRAREDAGLAPMERGTAEITAAEMREFYLSLAIAGGFDLESRQTGG